MDGFIDEGGVMWDVNALLTGRPEARMAIVMASTVREPAARIVRKRPG